jgi:hypothetical protein
MAERKNQKILITEPIHELSSEGPIKGRQTPPMTFVSDKLIPQSNVYIRFGWIYDMPDPNPHIHEHSHNYDEIVIHIGTDPDCPEDLGAELEFMVDGEAVKIDKTSALYIPKGVKHGPLTWKSVKRPHLEMAVFPGTSTFLEARPGGFVRGENT